MQLRVILGASVAFAVLATGVQAATDITVTNVAMNNPYVVNLSGPGINVNVNDSALLFTTNAGKVITTFCVDIWHTISVGAADITYAEQPLLTNSSGALSGTGAALSNTQVGEIGALADLGTSLVRQGGSDMAVDLAGVQAAIWSIEYPQVSVTGNSAVIDKMAAYESYAVTHQATDVVALYDVAGVAQGQVMGVPEPGAWALMLVGFAVLGTTLRSRRRIAPVLHAG